MPYGDNAITEGIRQARQSISMIGIRVERELPSLDGDAISFRVIDERRGLQRILMVTYEAYADALDVARFIRDQLLNAVSEMRGMRPRRGEGGEIPPPVMPDLSPGDSWQNTVSGNYVYMTNDNGTTAPQTFTWTTDMSIRPGDVGYTYSSGQPMAARPAQQPYPAPPEHANLGGPIEHERGPRGFRAIPSERPKRRALPC